MSESKSVWPAASSTNTYGQAASPKPARASRGNNDGGAERGGGEGGRGGRGGGRGGRGEGGRGGRGEGGRGRGRGGDGDESRGGRGRGRGRGGRRGGGGGGGMSPKTQAFGMMAWLQGPDGSWNVVAQLCSAPVKSHGVKVDPIRGLPGHNESPEACASRYFSQLTAGLFEVPHEVLDMQYCYAEVFQVRLELPDAAAVYGVAGMHEHNRALLDATDPAASRGVAVETALAVPQSMGEDQRGRQMFQYLTPAKYRVAAHTHLVLRKVHEAAAAASVDPLDFVKRFPLVKMQRAPAVRGAALISFANAANAKPFERTKDEPSFPSAPDADNVWRYTAYVAKDAVPDSGFPPTSSKKRGAGPSKKNNNNKEKDNKDAEKTEEKKVEENKVDDKATEEKKVEDKKQE